MRQARYIVVEGPPGAGKTRLAELLAGRLGGRAVVEGEASGPWSEVFWRQRPKDPFQTQMLFLIHRFQRQQALGQLDLFDACVVGDCLFARDRVYAGLSLDEAEFTLYDQIFRVLAERLVRPDLVIYLQTSPRVLIDRIRRLKRSYARQMSGRYLERVIEAYNDFFFHYRETALLVISANDLHLDGSSGELDDILAQVEDFGGGVKYYVPLAQEALI
jgi:deoxyadenosine/deoxycytidine kinase